MPPKKKASTASSSSSRKKRRTERKAPPQHKRINDEQERAIRDVYGQFDTLEGGGLTLSDAKKAMKQLGVNMKKDEIQSWSATSGKQKTTRTTGSDPVETHIIDENNFFRMAGSKLIQKEKVEKAFSLFDRDCKGLIVVEDLERVAAELGEDMSSEELEEMVELVDPGGDGLISQQDFYRLAQMINL